MSIPDAELVIGNYLRNAATVQAITTRVAGKTPTDTDDPWIRLTLLDDPETDGGIAGSHIAAFVQIDCYAGKTGGQEEASALRLAVREALRTMHLADHGSVVVSGARVTSSRQPDSDFEPARERCIISATVWMR